MPQRSQNIDGRSNLMILIALTAIIVYLILPRSLDVTFDNEPSVEEDPTAINMLLDNSMSDFESTKRFDREIENFMRRWELKGGSFALMRNDSLLYAKGYGMANDTTQCNVNHVFRIASVSKLITATAVMKLVEENKLSLDSKVFGKEGILNDSLFLDMQSKNLELVTVEHLLRHTAGFSSPHGDPAFFNYNIARFLDKDLPLTAEDMVLYATKNRFRSRPGDRYDYSNLGYIILGEVVERVAQMDYETFVRDSILTPAGCYDMFVGESFSYNRAPNEVNYYEVKEAEPVEAFDGSGLMTMKSNGGNNIQLLGAAGGWVASPTELLRLVAAIDGCDNKRDILNKETVKLMTYDSRHNKPIGWATVRGKEWLRSGSMAGTTAMVKHQANGYTWVFVTNSSAWISYRLGNYISSHFSRAIAKVDKWPCRDLFQVEAAAEVVEEQVEPSDSLDSEVVSLE